LIEGGHVRLRFAGAAEIGHRQHGAFPAGQFDDDVALLRGEQERGRNATEDQNRPWPSSPGRRSGRPQTRWDLLAHLFN